MARDIQNNEFPAKSPSKIRGGGAQAPGALKGVLPKDTSLIGDVERSVDSPALTGTPSYPRGGVSHSTPAANSPISQGSSPGRSSYSKGASQPKGHQVMNCPEMKFFRRELRSHGTSAEASLWKLLKGKQIAGLQFRRQFSVGDFILDFYCPSLKLAIELDGDYHYHMAMPDRDWERDRVLLDKFGIKTLRFENKIVFNHPESIRDSIIQELNAKSL